MGINVKVGMSMAGLKTLASVSLELDTGYCEISYWVVPTTKGAIRGQKTYGLTLTDAEACLTHSWLINPGPEFVWVHTYNPNIAKVKRNITSYA